MIDPRIGKFTASEIWKLLSNEKSKKHLFGKTAITYITSRVTEITTGETISDSQELSSKATEWGKKNEPLAIKAYEEKFNITVHGKQDFIPYGDNGGATPDGLVGDDGMTEIKCPFNPTNHTANMLIIDQKAFSDYHKVYYPQIQMQLLCSGRSWVDFVSFDPRCVNDAHKLHVIRIYRDDAMIQELEYRILEAVKIRNEMLNVINNRLL